MKTQIVKMMSRFRRDESGATIVEYGIALLIVLGIGLAIITGIGTELNEIFSAVQTALASR